MKKINILFLAGAKRVSLAEKFIEAGKKLDIDINIFSYELSKEVPIYFVAKEIIIGKTWKSKDIYRHLIKIIWEKKINIVLPFVDQATIVLARLKQMIDSGIFIPISEPEKVDVFFDKISAYNWCLKNNVVVPTNDNKGIPLIAKPRFGSASKGIVKIVNTEQIKEFDENEYLIQKFIEGKEYTVDCYVSFTGEIISVTPRERLAVQGGEAIKSITVKDNRLISFAIEVLKKSKLKGPITIQFLKEKTTNNIYFMELNPRFGGAVLTSIGAGANIPEYLLRDFLGEKQVYFEEWEDGLLMIRRFNEYYIKCK